MPFFKLDTNVSKDKVTLEFLKSTSKLIASTLGKPESYVGVQVNAEQAMIFGGSDAPAGNASLMSIGQLGIEPNKKHASAIYDHVNKHLGIPKDSRTLVKATVRLRDPLTYRGTAVWYLTHFETNNRNVDFDGDWKRKEPICYPATKFKTTTVYEKYLLE